MFEAMGSDGEVEVKHEDTKHRGAFFVERDGKRVAKQTYKRADERTVTVDHTLVDESLRGQGVARRLLDALVAWARASGTRVRATCPYARAQFEKDESIQDVYER